MITFSTAAILGATAATAGVAAGVTNQTIEAGRDKHAGKKAEKKRKSQAQALREAREEALRRQQTEQATNGLRQQTEQLINSTTELMEDESLLWTDL